MESKHLEIQGIDCVNLAKKVGTPLVVYDQEKIESQLRDYKRLFHSDRLQCDVVYASKAFLCDAMIALVKENECCLDVVSGGELYSAYQAGFPMERVFFHGNNKSKQELEMALKYGIGTIVVDNAMECEYLCQLATSLKKPANIMFRLNPGIEAHTHQYIVTAHVDSKFGIGIAEMDTIASMMKLVTENEYLQFLGFHAHIGSQIFDENAYVAEIETLMNFIHKIEHRSNISVTGLNLGGGFAATYTQEDAPIPLARVCEVITTTCERWMDEYQLSISRIMIEPGRSIVAEAGCSLYEIGYQKQTPHRNYIFVDGGMSDNIRPALYQAKYHCDIANRLDEAKSEVVSVAGKCCESGDIVAEDVHLPKAQSGDILVVYTTGAYGYSMASNYNRLPRPAVVFTKAGKARVVIERESYEDLHSLECDVEIDV